MGTVSGLAAAFIDLGYSWPAARGPRRLSFISTPCESAAAGLIALGAMLRRLQQPGTDDLSAHLARLRSLTPEGSYRVVLRNRHHKGRRFGLIRDEAGEIWFQELGRKDPDRRLLLDPHASNWYFDDEPPVEGHKGIELPHRALYESLLPNDAPVPGENLRRTDSGIVLAGRAGGRSATEQILGDIRFRSNAQEVALSELLAVHGWQPQNVSRIRYFNPRAGMSEPFDRPGPAPDLVVADGPRAFEAILDCPETVNSDVLSVIPRIADPDQLEKLAQRVQGLTQWYDANLGIGADLPLLPPGVEIVTLLKVM